MIKTVIKETIILERRAAFMLIPRYYFSNDYTDFYQFFLTRPHIRKTFKRNQYLWNPGEHVNQVYYIISGVAQTSILHENGSRKICSLHSQGTVFPGCHQAAFKIEHSIITTALSSMETLCFTNEEFLKMLCDNQKLMLRTLDWYAAYINLLLYESAHQDYNSSFIKLCNLLYLFSQNSPDGKSSPIIHLTQENIAEILTVTRVNAARNLSRLRAEGIIASHHKWLEILDLQALEAYCSQETLKN